MEQPRGVALAKGDRVRLTIAGLDQIVGRKFTLYRRKLTAVSVGTVVGFSTFMGRDLVCVKVDGMSTIRSYALAFWERID